MFFLDFLFKQNFMLYFFYILLKLLFKFLSLNILWKKWISWYLFLKVKGWFTTMNSIFVSIIYFFIFHTIIFIIYTSFYTIFIITIIMFSYIFLLFLAKIDIFKYFILCLIKINFIVWKIRCFFFLLYK